MEAFVITTTLLGSFVGAFALQKAALAGLFRMMDTERTLIRADARRARR